MKLHERFSCSLLSRTYPSQTEISTHIGISSASISLAVKRLQDHRIVDEIKEGKFKRYKLHGDSKTGRCIVEELLSWHLEQVEQQAS